MNTSRMDRMNWNVKPFAEVSVQELHDALKLRVDIFVVEQKCAYAEIDGQDPTAWHVLGHDASGTLVAYARILPAHGTEPPHIGRVVVREDQRGSGLAHELMEHSLRFLEEQFGSRTSALAAQAHLERFYAKHGYVRVSENYLWDGIPHVDMRLSAPA